MKIGDIIRVSSYDEIIKIVEEVNNKYHNENYKCFFRGQADESWKLIPGMLRKKCNEKTEIDDYNLTDITVRMAAAQHYGKTTRCLDFSRDYNVALYFATHDDIYNDKDGALYIFYYYSHKPSWFTNYLMYYVATMNKDEITNWELTKYLLDKKNIIDEFKRTKRKTELFEATTEVEHYIANGFLVDFENADYDVDRLMKQKGALYFFGSQFYHDSIKIIDNDIRYSNGITYNINLHELVDHKLDERTIKIIIPKEIKEEIYNKINITSKDLGF